MINIGAFASGAVLEQCSSSCRETESSRLTERPTRFALVMWYADTDVMHTRAQIDARTHTHTLPTPHAQRSLARKARTNRSVSWIWQVFAGLGETREITGPTNGANAELFFWNVGAAMDHDVDETADCTAVA